MTLLLLGPPCGQQHVLIRLRGGGPKCLKICSKNHFLSQSRCVAGPRFWSKLLQIEAASLLGPPFRPEIRRRLPLGFSWAALGLLLGGSWLLLGCPWQLLGSSWLLLGSSSHTQVYAQAVLKVGAPGDVSSVGGTPGVWCLNVIGRECWVWVVPCTGSWPGQPPPTKWGKEP